MRKFALPFLIKLSLFLLANLLSHLLMTNN